MGPRSSVWFNAVLDGDEAEVELGEGSNVQDNCLVQGVAGYPARLGAFAAMGHNARVIGATVEEHALIAIGASVLKGAHVGTGSIVAANATVPEGMNVPPRSLVIGPGRIARQTTDQEIERIHHTSRSYLRLSDEHAGRSGLIS
jgi:carbonic anhydrase/acetyltransferase-like protein (isoleucine patch superfamily)